jgi:excisionase family DNA binding protein
MPWKGDNISLLAERQGVNWPEIPFDGKDGQGFSIRRKARGIQLWRQSMIPQLGKMYAIKEAAAILGVGRDTVVRLIRSGQLKCVELPRTGGRGRNKKRLIPERELDRFVREHSSGFLGLTA